MEDARLSRNTRVFAIRIIRFNFHVLFLSVDLITSLLTFISSSANPMRESIFASELEASSTEQMDIHFLLRGRFDRGR